MLVSNCSCPSSTLLLCSSCSRNFRPSQGSLKARTTNDHRSPSDSMNLSSERSYPLTPSPASAGVVAALPSRPPATSTIEDGGIIDHQIAQTNTTPEDTQPHDNEDVHVHSRRPPLTSASTSTPLSTSTSVEPANRFRDRPNGFPTDSKEVEPYFAGESEGLEFLFDQVAPDRPVVGVHYLTPRRTYRHKRPRIYRPSSQELGSHIALPPRPVQQELVKCFCYYVYPTMPVVDLRDFVETFESDTRSVSQLLLWSVFFAALNVR